MQSIKRRGQAVLAGLVGGLVGALVFAFAAGAPVQPVAPVQATSGASRIPRAVLEARQQAEEESYPSRMLSAAVGATGGTAGPLDWHGALQAHQDAEQQYYPSRLSGTATLDWRDALRAKQQIEREYYPGH